MVKHDAAATLSYTRAMELMANNEFNEKMTKSGLASSLHDSLRCLGEIVAFESDEGSTVPPVVVFESDEGSTVSSVD